MLSSTPVPPTAAKIGGLTTFDFAAKLSPVERLVKGAAAHAWLKRCGHMRAHQRAEVTALQPFMAHMRR